MKDIKRSLNLPVNKYFAAIVIALVAIVLPVYGLYGIDWKKSELNVLSILLPLLWIVFVSGFIFLAMGKKGISVTSEDADKKISIVYSNIQKKLTPVRWILGMTWLIWMAYLVWSLRVKA